MLGFLGRLFGSEKAKSVISEIKQRQGFEAKLKQVKKDLKEIKRAIHGRKL